MSDNDNIFIPKMDLMKFTEWVGNNYVRLGSVWCHRFKNQLDKDNHKTTNELFHIWYKIEWIKRL